MKKLYFIYLMFFFGYLSNGQSLSEIMLVDVKDSKSYDLNQVLGDSKALVFFVDNDCPYVSYYNERIKALAELASSKNMTVLFVNPHQQKVPDKNSLDQMKLFMNRVGWKGRFFSDPKQHFVQLLQANKLPEVFIVETSNGKLKVLFKGPIDDNPQNAEYVNVRYAEEAIKQIISNGVAKSNTTMNTMGCRIRKF